ncbi:probable 2-oxoglutarate dehydrogenase E1 component DHKTD1 homolog, mitochondrial [Schistocerca nitens]|uniref:probable 2-oxoglutarate dehydrogenase E1 component DHKTD1 homolog, mitochondrial n=1 Tax=Schistocerca nitens TaxID=7011 RepID=UPI002117686B|nr:probable 2-oxoglutarate dehydrogenase E1 component DHKTD1 homolog, mitochondrial [Schistocerca nitens]
MKLCTIVLHSCVINTCCKRLVSTKSSTKLSVYNEKCFHLLGKPACRKYHARNGVYGYFSRVKNDYKVPEHVIEARNRNSNLCRLVQAYREHGHKKADINPISIEEPRDVPELNYRLYGLTEDENYNTSGILLMDAETGSLSDILHFLHKTYCGPLSAEFNYLEEEEEREWWAQRMERLSSEELDSSLKKNLAKELLKSQAFDNFLANKFVTVKRYGGEGAESMMGFFIELLQYCASDGLEEIVIGMPHRGRLNLLTGLFEFHPGLIFRKLKGLPEFPDDVKTCGDVISHFVSSVDLNISGRPLHITILYNPSHLEAVNPVSMGKTRGRQQTVNDGTYYREHQPSDKVLNVQVHGDAAFSGQGVNQETLQLCKVPHFEVGGTVHLIVNNQLGFTTPAERGRSSRYPSDLAKMISAPVLHVNGDYPELVVKATRIAMEYQRKFRKEVFIDLNCFRRWGHNELDDPTFTNPAVYNIINSRRSVPDLYAESLANEGILSTEEAKETTGKHTEWLNNILKTTDMYKPEAVYFKNLWSKIKQAPAAVTTWDTGVDEQLLHYIGIKSVTYPDNFSIHSHLQKTHIQGRLKKLADRSNIDWSTAEALAFGSLLYQGYNVRISGQDVGRGTFSHRHVMLVDQSTNEMYIPLNDLVEGQEGHLEVANSILSEEAVLGFEYGMSIENPNRLVIWEAQFGDFFNGAQIQIDTYITGGESRWMTCSGLVMMLPHGYDGAGPEHSSCRIERFLQLSDSSETTPDGDDVNIHIVNPTTPAQYFHLLRRQVLWPYRKPLIIVTPKTLLRLPEATSSLSDMSPGTTFSPVIGDDKVNAQNVTKIIFVSGKHYYALEAQRQKLNVKDVAIVRVEGLSPFPLKQLQQEIAKYKFAKVFIWSQEEHQNMGAWNFARTRFENLLGRKLRYAGRPPLAAAAVGVAQWHQKEAQSVISQPFIMK